MKAVTIVPILLLATLSAVAVFSIVSNHGQAIPQDIITKYQIWQSKFGKLYATPSENLYRLRVFADSCAQIDSDNDSYNRNLAAANQPPLSGPMFSINQFSDLSEAEFSARFTGLIPSTESLEAPKVKVAPSAPSLSQTPYQYRVRNQGSCGSCWAFTAIAQVEKLYFDTKRVQLDFSQRDLVDCDDQSNGCDGGSPVNGLRYIKNNGIALASAYPYNQNSYKTSIYCPRARNEVPRTRFGAELAAKVYAFSSGYTNSILQKGAVVGLGVYATKKFASVSSNDDAFSPAYAGECGFGANHVVAAANLAGGYINIQNSWSTQWGRNGFKKMIPCSENEFYGRPSEMFSAVAAY